MKRVTTLIYLTAMVLSANAQKQTNMEINQEAPVVQSKSIIINARPEKIWNVLSDVQNWTNWNNKIKKVQSNGKLKKGSEFIWTAGSSKITSIIHTYDYCKSLGWTGKTFGAQAIHNWYFENMEHGAKITVEESMEGFLVRLMKKKVNKILEQDTILWLEQLKAVCEK